MSILLPIAIFLPLVASILIGRDRESAFRLALVATLATCATAILPAVRILLDNNPGESMGIDLPWFSAAGGLFSVRFAVGLDGLSAWPFGLMCLAMPFVVAADHKLDDGKESGYYRLLLLMQTGFLGIFAAHDALLFFVFYASVTIPFFFLLGTRGHKGRRTAMQFICIDTSGAVAVLLGLLAVVAMRQLPVAEPEAMSGELRLGIFLTLVAGFAVRVITPPLVTHLDSGAGLPDAVAGFLPSVLLSVGGVYGMLRFARPILADVSSAVWPWVVGIASGGAICACTLCVVLLFAGKGASA